MAVAGGDLPEAAADPPLTARVVAKSDSGGDRATIAAMATTDTYLAGNYAPVSEEITATELAVTGTIPAELDGRLIRNGPNPIDGGHPDAHWFTGTGMVHGVRLRDGRADWYRNRYVVSDRVAEATGRPITPGPRSTTPRAPPTPT